MDSSRQFSENIEFVFSLTGNKQKKGSLVYITVELEGQDENT